MPDYIDSYDERALEIEKEFNYDGYQIVRRELFAHLREPSVTIRANSITFNAACIQGLEEAVYIQILIREDQKRMVIRKCNENDKDAIRWCIEKQDKRKSRRITGRFSKQLYTMMKWIENYRYKILGHKIHYQGETLYVFELEECEIFREKPKRTKAEKEARAASMTPEELKAEDQRERKESMTPFSPENVENTFGLPVDKHYNQITLDSFNIYQGISSMNDNGRGGNVS